MVCSYSFQKENDRCVATVGLVCYEWLENGYQIWHES